MSSDNAFTLGFMYLLGFGKSCLIRCNCSITFLTLFVDGRGLIVLYGYFLGLILIPLSHFPEP
nr:MAG TPA: hypothetical protein [Caudoviricetes sp.]